MNTFSQKEYTEADDSYFFLMALETYRQIICIFWDLFVFRESEKKRESAYMQAGGGAEGENLKQTPPRHEAWHRAQSGPWDHDQSKNQESDA